MVMKTIVTILLLVVSKIAYSQNKSKTHVINQECNLLIISSDSLVCTKLDNHVYLLDSTLCFAYSSKTNTVATMYWFDINMKDAILNEIFHRITIY
jgi:hypothetical protein